MHKKNIIWFSAKCLKPVTMMYLLNNKGQKICTISHSCYCKNVSIFCNVTEKANYSNHKGTYTPKYWCTALSPSILYLHNHPKQKTLQLRNHIIVKEGIILYYCINWKYVLKKNGYSKCTQWEKKRAIDLWATILICQIEFKWCIYTYRKRQKQANSIVTDIFLHLFYYFNLLFCESHNPKTYYK